MTQSNASSAGSRLELVLQGVTMLVLALAVGIYVAAPILAFRFRAAPFLGGYLEITRVFNDFGSDEADPNAFSDGVRPFDQVLAIDGVTMTSAAEVQTVVRQHQVGDRLRLRLAHRAGGESETLVTLRRFPDNVFLSLFVVPYFIGLVYLAIGLWVFRLRRGEPAGRAFALFCAMVAGTLVGLFDSYTSLGLVWAWTYVMPGVGAALFNLGLVFPQEISFLRTRPGVRLAISYLPWLALSTYTFVSYASPDPWLYLPAWIAQDLMMGAGILAFLGAMFYRWRAGASPLVREQGRIILIGALAGTSLLLIWLAQVVGLSLLRLQPAPFNVINILPTICLPAAVAYAILRYRLLDTDRLVGQALVYAAMGVITLAAYGLILTGVSLLVGTVFGPNNPVVVGLTIFLLVLAFNPARERLQRLVDDAFFRGGRAYAQQVEAYSRALTRAGGLAEISALLEETIDAALKPARFNLFLLDKISDTFAPYAREQTTGGTEVRFAQDGPLAATLRRDRTSLLFSAERPLPAPVAGDRARLAVLGAALYVPLLSKDNLGGWLALGPRLSGEPYMRDALRFVEALADQSALAIERASVIADLERRVKELNVLSQMSQAVNFILTYDDLLELIYAQASKVVNTRHFYIILKEAHGAAFSYAFYLEDDERDSTRENQPWPADRGLAVEVVRTGQPIRTDDYRTECQKRGLPPRNPKFKAWLGVPLNAGAETIGVMSAASTDPLLTYTDEQLKIFAAIADQAASAIVKTRLYQQTEQRARQLGTLNEVSTSLSSTLELDVLLQRITQSSTDILESQAGSLFLTDDETGEIVFRVAVGAAGQNLVGMRLAPGKGIVGGTIESGKALIVNDVQNDPRWFKGADQSSGFVTRALMVAPLSFQGKPIGALEVINKRDGTAFTEEDQSLLTAFAGPAAVAIQNARLFTMTDQALAARVEELSVMQRIDRELNTALDMRRVLDITLRWAMKNTGATAGLAALAAADGLNVAAASGFDAALTPGDPPRLPAGRGLAAQVLRSGEVGLVRQAEPEGETAPLLASSRAQLALPLMSERSVAGVLVLESPSEEAFSEEEVAFATRLLDHASIAITNARLYAEVNAANIAKSEFVSFVAHELKTPMTSIKGYADLLLGSAVGPVNDMQRQFLGTIRGNVERMATLVSDLADVARIESGRLKLEPKAINLLKVVEDVVRTTQAMIDHKQQTLTQNVEADLPPALGDYTRLTQVLTNLLSNAYKYTPEGGEITLTIERSANRWDPAGAPQVLHITVRDNGIGIAPEDQAKLFQKFFRADDRMAREMAPGTGLGLNIVKNLVELQGGRIWFESEFRKGSAFHFTVPTAAEGAQANA